MEINISKVNLEHFNPFGATQEELVANALNEAGLASKDTLINGYDISTLCGRYYDKRKMFRQSTKMGNILVKHQVITPEQLHKTLLYQKKHPGKRFGDALIALGICSRDSVNEFLQAQERVRKDIKYMDCFTDNSSPIKQCIKSYVC